MDLKSLIQSVDTREALESLYKFAGEHPPRYFARSIHSLFGEEGTVTFIRGIEEMLGRRMPSAERLWFKRLLRSLRQTSLMSGENRRWRRFVEKRLEEIDDRLSLLEARDDVVLPGRSPWMGPVDDSSPGEDEEVEAEPSEWVLLGDVWRHNPTGLTVRLGPERHAPGSWKRSPARIWLNLGLDMAIAFRTRGDELTVFSTNTGRLPHSGFTIFSCPFATLIETADRWEETGECDYDASFLDSTPN